VKREDAALDPEAGAAEAAVFIKGADFVPSDAFFTKHFQQNNPP
jgi:hypothetical protein